MNFFRIAVIVGALPNIIANGQVEDANPVMADFNWIVNQVNANAAPLTNTALLNAANHFTQAQSSTSALAPQNMALAGQVQNFAFNTLVSTLGTNSLTAHIIDLPLVTRHIGQIFTFIPSQTNTSGIVSMNAGAGATPVSKFGLSSILASDIVINRTAVLIDNGTAMELINPQTGMRSFANGANGTVLGFLSSEATGTRAFNFGSFASVSGATIFLIGASNADQKAAVNSQVAVVPSVQQSHPSAIKAWGFITTPTTVSKSYPSSGVSVIKNAGGNYTITHGVTFDSSTYQVSFSPHEPSATLFYTISNTSTTTFTVSITNTTVAFDPTAFSYSVAGVLA